MHLRGANHLFWRPLLYLQLPWQLMVTHIAMLSNFFIYFYFLQAKQKMLPPFSLTGSLGVSNSGAAVCQAGALNMSYWLLPILLLDCVHTCQDEALPLKPLC